MKTPGGTLKITGRPTTLKNRSEFGLFCQSIFTSVFGKRLPRKKKKAYKKRLAKSENYNSVSRIEFIKFENEMAQFRLHYKPYFEDAILQLFKDKTPPNN